MPHLLECRYLYPVSCDVCFASFTWVPLPVSSIMWCMLCLIYLSAVTCIQYHVMYVMPHLLECRYLYPVSCDVCSASFTWVPLPVSSIMWCMLCLIYLSAVTCIQYHVMYVMPHLLECHYLYPVSCYFCNKGIQLLSNLWHYMYYAKTDNIPTPHVWYRFHVAHHSDSLSFPKHIHILFSMNTHIMNSNSLSMTGTYQGHRYL